MSPPQSPRIDAILNLLRCPESGSPLRLEETQIVSEATGTAYPITDGGIPLFAGARCSPAAKAQQQHYDRIAQAYTDNLQYPHTRAYLQYLDDVLDQVVAGAKLQTCAEVCCGTGEAFALYGDQLGKGIGIDISTAMLERGQAKHDYPHLFFVQGDATVLPLASESFDTIFMLGGIHHVPDRAALFREVHRILKPGGQFIWREPLSDFWLWKLLRAAIYRASPILDHETERPLVAKETIPVLEEAGLVPQAWRSCGFIGFCLLMNSDVLFFNRFFRFVPGIAAIARGFARLDAWCLKLPGLRNAGLQVVGNAVKPVSMNEQ